MPALGLLERAARKPGLEPQTPGAKFILVKKVFVKVLFRMRLGNFQTCPKHPEGCRLALHPCFFLCLNKAGHKFHRDLFRGKSNFTD